MYSCKAEHARIAALYKSGRLQNTDEQFKRGINICIKASDLVYANGIRFYVASLALRARVELIRHAISTAAKGGEVPDVPISASFGVTSVMHVGYELRELLVAADDALYQAKREGRNRISVSDGREGPCPSAVGMAVEEM